MDVDIVPWLCIKRRMNGYTAQWPIWLWWVSLCYHLSSTRWDQSDSHHCAQPILNTLHQKYTPRGCLDLPSSVHKENLPDFQLVLVHKTEFCFNLNCGITIIGLEGSLCHNSWQSIKHSIKHKFLLDGRKLHVILTMKLYCLLLVYFWT